MNGFGIRVRRARARHLLPLLAMIAATGPAAVQAGSPLGANDWMVYGTPYAHGRDAAVPGQGILVVPAGPRGPEPWSRGAGVPIPDAIAAGERVTAVFWARAARPTRLTIGLQGAAPAYARFASAEVTLTPRWQRVSVAGTAPAAFAPRSQSLSVPLGHADAAVTLGPVAFLRGAVDDAAVARTFAAFRPAEVTTDVRIAAADGATLAGTLHLPVGPANARFPLVVLVQGHGPNGRGGFTEIVRRLTADGIAALEYDKRGVGQSTGAYKEDIARLTADAAAAAHRRVALLGHSQGGVIAPAVAAADPTIAGIVTLAGSVGDGLPYIRRALLRQMIAAGRPEAQAAPAVDASIALIQARIDGAEASTIAARRNAVVEQFEAAGFPRPQAQDALARIDTEEARQANRLRSASDLKALRIPVLAVFASKDKLVVAGEEAPDARRALAANPRGTVVVLDGLSHWFQEGAKTGDEDEVARLGPNAGSPRLVALVGDWLRDVLVRNGALAGTATR